MMKRPISHCRRHVTKRTSAGVLCATPQAETRQVPVRPSACSDETGSAAYYTSTSRSHDVTGFSAPTGCGAARVPDRGIGPSGTHPARLAGRAGRALRPPQRVQWADREPQPENQEHQADRPRLPQLRPLPAAVVAQPRPHPRRSLTDANQNPHSQVRCVEPGNSGRRPNLGPRVTERPTGSPAPDHSPPSRRAMRTGHCHRDELARRPSSSLYVLAEHGDLDARPTRTAGLPALPRAVRLERAAPSCADTNAGAAVSDLLISAAGAPQHPVRSASGRVLWTCYRTGPGTVSMPSISLVNGMNSWFMTARGSNEGSAMTPWTRRRCMPKLPAS